jgi:hypothetical protein
MLAKKTRESATTDTITIIKICLLNEDFRRLNIGRTHFQADKGRDFSLPI